ncbi:hypothetical protein amrb99_81010 [Actinomadura sp. RB99]|uniref:hypothetical protein n=1 Tax=Actinomadura sp. RB99 TaxID=2691577 RepID=UPI0016829490|nr:hypothetical protein [Actinomadura sp. RB99]MBD2899118.1 hypothetical protein [Actinomadura sp. RB99]
MTYPPHGRGAADRRHRATGRRPAIGVGAVASGAATEPMKELLDAETRAASGRERPAPVPAAA